jgi:ribosomal protein S18 acetylase RimI-like enzyme
VICEDAGLDGRLGPQLVALGWRQEVLAVMAWPRAAPAPAPGRDAPPVEEGSHSDLVDAYRETLGTLHADHPAVAEQLLEESARVGAAARRLFVRADGRPAALCRLYIDGATAEIDDVSTLPAYRRRGLASALTLGAVSRARDAGCDLVFLRADAADSPRRLYQGLGFELIGRHYSWTRRPPAKSLASRA